MPELTFSNQLISRDEGLHAELACLLCGMLENKLPEDGVHGIIRGAVDVERRFMKWRFLRDLVVSDVPTTQAENDSLLDGKKISEGNGAGGGRPMDLRTNEKLPCAKQICA